MRLFEFQEIVLLYQVVCLRPAVDEHDAAEVGGEGGGQPLGVLVDLQRRKLKLYLRSLFYFMGNSCLWVQVDVGRVP